MMKGICAQCLCKHKNPETGEEYFGYSCYNQDQSLDEVDPELLEAFDKLGIPLHERAKLSSFHLATATIEIPD